MAASSASAQRADNTSEEIHPIKHNMDPEAEATEEETPETKVLSETRTESKEVSFKKPVFAAPSLSKRSAVRSGSEARKEDTVRSGSEARKEDTVRSGSEARKEDTVRSGSEARKEDTVRSGSEARKEDTVRSGSEARKEDTVRSGSEARKEDTVRSGSEARKEDTVRSGSEARKEDTVRSGSEARKEDTVRSGSEARKEDTVRSGSEARKEDTVRSGSEARKEDTVRSGSEARKEDTVRSGSEARKEDTVRSGSEARKEDTVRSGSEARKEDTVRSGSEARKEDTVRSGSEARKEDTVRSGSEARKEDTVNSTDLLTDAVTKPPDTQPEAKPKVQVKCPPPGTHPPLPYTEPAWGSMVPDVSYSIEILKNGSIVNTIPLKDKSFFVVGRLPVCEVALEHPSISRYHAIIQYRGESGETGSVGEERGFYVHDLGSTHGTVVNKNKIPPKTFIRLRVGHVIKFGGSTRLFILQGPETDEEEESEFTVTELKERARKQREELEKRMMGAGSDDEEEEEEEEEEEGENGEEQKNQSKPFKGDSGCSWGIIDDAVAEDENEENPFSTEFHEDQEAAYLKDPKKTLQGFYDREGEELDFEYEEKNSGTWLCRIKLPVDDAKGRQLVAEVTSTGKKKEVMVQCCLEACRMLEARGLLRQEAVSRKRKKKNWEDEDFYDSDDDTFLDRTGTVERKRQERMKKAGKIAERAETYETLLMKLAGVEKELEESQKKLDSERKGSSGSTAEDPLDAFMTAVRSEAAMDNVERRKLHVHVADLRKEVQRLRKLVELTRPAQLPSLLPSSDPGKAKKTLPLFGAMKGGSKFKLKTGTIGKLPPKRPNLPAQLFNMKELPPDVEEEEDEEEENKQRMEDGDSEDEEECVNMNEPEAVTTATGEMEEEELIEEKKKGVPKPRLKGASPKEQKCESQTEAGKKSSVQESSADPTSSESRPEAETGPKPKKKGPGRPPVPLTGGKYPDDDPDYCVWVPPVGQTGDGRTHLNEKYGY
uniref:FHA domain-containing protein n=1 Tax=Knipowitschia caucasica TaxID=637954 RepID=A0AAV2JAS4_KNICA